MKFRLTFLAAIAFAMALALVGVLKDVNTTRATMPLPVQPFAPQATGGISTTQLGQDTTNKTFTQSKQGERVTLPWNYSGPGWRVKTPAELPDGTDIGTVWSAIDVGCDGFVDHMQADCGITDPNLSPLHWYARTITPGPDESYLNSIMPPFTWLFRHRADIDHVCLGTGSPASISVLNTVYETIPNAPTVSGAKGFFETTILGGSPTTPPSLVCIDSPQTSQSNTNLYRTPLPAGVSAGGPTGAGGRDLDNNSGLYVRWTAFSSFGSTSLNLFGDLRKGFQSPPSIGSDIGYVERIVQVSCFWLDDNGCAGCDTSGDGAISAEESWQDPDLLAMGGINAVDQDRDCLMKAGTTQPGWGAPVDTQDAPTGVMCPPVPYSENPVSVVYDTAADTDCDGLVNGVEWAYGSNPNLADSDSDGAPDFVEMFQFTDPLDNDTDNDGFLDKPANVYTANTDHSMDNCPSVSNASQLNSDGLRRDNGLKIVNLYASNPNQDKLGDACDNDNDNDGAVNGYETSTVGKAATNPLLLDTDGDTVNDGAEWRRLDNGDLTAEPNTCAKKPSWNNTEQVYYRGCHINVNDIDYAAFAPYSSAGAAAHTEMDVDGDTKVCPGDGDSDNGHANKPELLDQYEAYGYNTQISQPDTDGDGCEDWIEIHDLNGDRTADSGDVGLMNKRVAGKITSDCTGTYPCCTAGTGVSDKIFDVNKDGVIDSGDQGSMNKNTCALKPWGGCPTCPDEGPHGF